MMHAKKRRYPHLYFLLDFGLVNVVSDGSWHSLTFVRSDFCLSGAATTYVDIIQGKDVITTKHLLVGRGDPGRLFMISLTDLEPPPRILEEL